jgi:SAM-dependent MidA family methyltransferase
MSGEVRAAVAAEIRAGGPIGFDRYMELALYGLGGYYERPPVGADGDFMTSPHVHPIFAQLLASAIEDLADGLGGPSPLGIAEVGAGDGTLATDLLRELADTAAVGAAGPIAYTAVERSSGARQALSSLAGIEVADSLDQVRGPLHVIVAHELCDNLHLRRFRIGETGPVEVLVGLDGDRLVEVEAPAAAAAAAADGEPPASLTDGLEPGEEVTWPVGALTFVDELAGRLAGVGNAAPGYALIIDYGGRGSSGGPLHGYRDHRVVADVLADPGSTDITAGVDFALLEDRAQSRGLQAFPSLTQRRALQALGLQDRLQEMLERQVGHLDAARGAEALQTWSDRNRVRLLADPAGLGRLRWLLLASPKLPEPAWLGKAREEQEGA